MVQKIKYFIAALAAAIGVFTLGTAVVASVTFVTPTQTGGTYKNYSFFAATTTAATSTNTTDGGGYLVTAGAKKLDFYFTHGGVATSSTGTSTFNVQISPDGVSWYDYLKLVTGTSSAPVQFVPIGGATSTVYASISTLTSDLFYAVRCIVTETGAGGSGVQGEHTCTASVEY